MNQYGKKSIIFCGLKMSYMPCFFVTLTNKMHISSTHIPVFPIFHQPKAIPLKAIKALARFDDLNRAFNESCHLYIKCSPLTQWIYRHALVSLCQQRALELGIMVRVRCYQLCHWDFRPTTNDNALFSYLHSHRQHTTPKLLELVCHCSIHWT